MYAREIRNAEELRANRDELMASVQTYRAPKEGESVKLNVIDGVAHIPIVGQLTPSADPCGAWMGLAETEYGFIQASVAAAEDDSKVSEIAFDVDSPGGYVNGLDETAQLIGLVTKPTTAYVGNIAASAAYWLASQADKIVALTPASEIGSIGVAAEEYDDDEALARDGIAHRVYTSTDAPNKRPDTKTEDGQAQIIAELDAVHGIFVRRVADGRGVSEETVNKKFGRGGMLIAEKAKSVGMIDEVRGSHIIRNTEDNTAVGGEKAAGPKASREVNMTEQEEAALKAAAYQEGIQAERKRVNGLTAWREINADTARIADEAIASGKSYDDVAAQLGAAAAKGKNAPAAAGENAPAVSTGVPATASGAENMDVPGMTAEDVSKLRAHGMTMDEIRANAPKRG